MELVHSAPDPGLQKRITRLMLDVRAIEMLLTISQLKSVYGELEAARDRLSKLLDKADGKNDLHRVRETTPPNP